MTENIEYGIYFQNSKLSLEKLFIDSMSYTYQVITENPCVYIKRPVFKKALLGLTKKYVESKVLHDVTDALYRNRDFEKKYYENFELSLFDTDINPTGEEYIPEIKNIPKHESHKIYRHQQAEFVEEEKVNQKYSNYRGNRNQDEEYGYWIRTGIRIPFDPKKPYSYDAYQTWVKYENWNYQENYFLRTVRKSNGKT